MKMPTNDGGSAFPVAEQFDERRGEYVKYAEDGMTLRDYFAVRASSDDIENHRTYSIDNDSTYGRRIYTMTVEQAKYAYADAMLAARIK